LYDIPLGYLAYLGIFLLFTLTYLALVHEEMEIGEKIIFFLMIFIGCLGLTMEHIIKYNRLMERRSGR
jgi:hypothetical protein